LLNEEVPVRAAAYTRLSEAKTKEEATELAVDRQEQRIRDLCSAKGWETARVYSDVDIGAYRAPGKKATPERPAFEAMLDAIRSGELDAIVVSKLDRLVRDHGDFERVLLLCELRGVALVSVAESIDTSTPYGEAMARNMVTYARLESQTIGLRIAWQREQAAKAGKPNAGGRRAFGYLEGRTAIKEDEAAIIRQAAQRVIRGDSLRSVASWMNTVSTGTTGKPWSQMTVRSMLLSPALAGWRIYRGALYEATWPPILSRDEWDAVCAVLANRHKKMPRDLGAPGKFLLSGMVACGHCGAICDPHHEPKARGGRREYLCFKNPGRRGCGRLAISAVRLEQLVEEQVLQFLARPALQEALAARPGVDPSVLTEQRAAEARLLQIEEEFADGGLTMAEYRRHRERLTNRINAAQVELAKQAKLTVLTDLSRTEEKLRAYWAQAPLEQKRVILKAVASRVIVGPAKIRGGRWDPSRVAPPYGIQWRI
jgi:site-specific DNA recombinase